MQTIIDRLAVEDAGMPDPTTLPPEDGRALAEADARRWIEPKPEMATAEDSTLGGREVRILIPHNDEGNGAILYIHGGGWAFGGLSTHETIARKLAIEAAAPVIMVAYRLAPENPFPAGLEDCVAAWRAFAVSEHTTGRTLGIAGDSAGANLALAVMLHEAGRRHLPAMGLLFYGVYAPDFDSPSHIAFAEAPGLTRAKMMRYWDWYALGETRESPLVSPMRADDRALLALPPLYMNAAGLDPLRSESERLHARLIALGRRDVLTVYEGVIHGFMKMSRELPEAREALTEAGQAFRRIA